MGDSSIGSPFGTRNTEMEENNGDYKNLLKQKHFLGEIEQGIRFANNEIIHKQVPMLSKENILSFAVAVGRLRANYLDAAFCLGQDEKGDSPNTAKIDDLKRHRELYEEARIAFEALRDAIEKGYVDVDILRDEDTPEG